jgi:hypothetical protein
MEAIFQSFLLPPRLLFFRSLFSISHRQMFRKKPLPPPKEIEAWPTTLDGYGLFISENDQVRLIVRPEDKMIYKLTNSTEYNDRRLSALRRILLDVVGIETDG